MNNVSREESERAKRGLNEASKFRIIDLLPAEVIERLKLMRKEKSK